MEKADFEAGRKKIEMTKKKDANNLIYFLCFSGFVLVVALLVACLGDGWQFHKLTGFGFTCITITTSLFEVNLNVKCGGKNTVEEIICARIAKAPAGVFTLHDAQNNLCALMPPVCMIMRNLYLCSFILFAAAFLATVAQVFGLMVLYNYWFVSPLPKLKRLGLALLALTLTILVAGLTMWTCLCPDITLIPMFMNQLTAPAGAIMGSVFRINPGAFLAYGWCWFLWIGITVLSLGQLTVVAVFFKAHEGEKAAVEGELQEFERLLAAKYELEDARAGFGGANYEEMIDEMMAQQLQQFSGAPVMQPGMPGQPPPGMPGQYPGITIQHMQPMQPGMHMQPMQPGMPMQPYPGAPGQAYPMQPGANYGSTM